MSRSFFRPLGENAPGASTALTHGSGGGYSSGHAKIALPADFALLQPRHDGRDLVGLLPAAGRARGHFPADPRRAHATDCGIVSIPGDPHGGRAHQGGPIPVLPPGRSSPRDHRGAGRPPGRGWGRELRGHSRRGGGGVRDAARAEVPRLRAHSCRLRVNRAGPSRAAGLRRAVNGCPARSRRQGPAAPHPGNRGGRPRRHPRGRPLAAAPEDRQSPRQRAGPDRRVQPIPLRGDRLPKRGKERGEIRRQFPRTSRGGGSLRGVDPYHATRPDAPGRGSHQDHRLPGDRSGGHQPRGGGGQAPRRLSQAGIRRRLLPRGPPPGQPLCPSRCGAPRGVEARLRGLRDGGNPFRRFFRRPAGDAPGRGHARCLPSCAGLPAPARAAARVRISSCSSAPARGCSIPSGGSPRGR